MGDRLYATGRESQSVFQALEKLEQLVEGATRIPLTGKIVIEAQTVLDLVDQLRALLPAEIGEAQRLSKERERVLADAARRAQEIKEAAVKEAERRLQDTDLVKQANTKAQEIIQKAELTAREIHSGAEAYADEILGRLEMTLEKGLTGIRQGRQELKARRARTA